MKFLNFVALVWLLGSVCALAADTVPPITALEVSPDGKHVAVGSQAGVEIRSYSDLEFERRLETRLSHVHDLAFSPGGDVLAAVGGTPAESGEIEFFRWPDGELIRRAKPHDDLIYCVDWAPGGSRWATASADGTVFLGGQQVQRLKGHSRPVTSVVFLPDGKIIVSAGLDNSLRVWDAATGELVRTLDNHIAAVRAVAVRPGRDDDLPMIASAGADRTIRFWQPTIGRLMRFARVPADPLDIDWTPDGNQLLAACADGKLRVVDPVSVEVRPTLDGVDGWAYAIAAANADRFALIAGEDHQLRRIPLDPPP